jgi:hypothetical protein
MEKRNWKDRIPFYAFVASTIFVAWAYGVAVGWQQIFPFRVVRFAKYSFDTATSFLKTPDYYLPTPKPIQPPPGAGHPYPGLNLSTRINDNRQLVADVTTLDGRKLHTWHLDWYDIWPDATHIPGRLRPRSPPGTLIHGSALLDSGDLVFNFESLGLVRVGRRGEVRWRLPYQTHHTVHLHDDGNLWVCGQIEHTKPDPRFPNRVPPFEEDTVIVVSPEGRILEEWSVLDLLNREGLTGLLYLGTLDNVDTKVGLDLTHLNDVEPFPETMTPGFFKPGDVMISLRNLNAIVVFERASRKIKFLSIGRVIRQHDPDFLDGNRISVFDNNNNEAVGAAMRSRIVIITAPANTLEVYFEGSPRLPFFTETMGKHQWLPNGNLLITEGNFGRAIELDPERKPVWSYVNEVEPGITAYATKVERLPAAAERLFR